MTHRPIHRRARALGWPSVPGLSNPTADISKSGARSPKVRPLQSYCRWRPHRLYKVLNKAARGILRMCEEESPLEACLGKTCFGPLGLGIGTFPRRIFLNSAP